MNKVDKYCTSKQSMELVKLDIFLKTGNHWFTPTGAETRLLRGHVFNNALWTGVDFPAIDVPEIMSILPTEIETDKGTAVLWIHRTEDREYEAGYIFKDWKFTVEYSTGEHLAQTLMDFLLWCIDNGHLKAGDIKL